MSPGILDWKSYKDRKEESCILERSKTLLRGSLHFTSPALYSASYPRMQFIAAPLTAGVLQFSLKPPKSTSNPLKPSQTTSKHLKPPKTTSNPLKPSQTTSLFFCLELHLSDDLRLREAVWSNYKPY